MLGAVLGVSVLFGLASSSIIPPAWANLTTNPCAVRSWQLIYWPLNNDCYRIFSKGPCKKGEEIYFDTDTNTPSCRCERGRVYHPHGEGGCYPAYTRGPCKHREFLDISNDIEEEAICTQFRPCEPGYVFWPPDGECYRQHVRGPCQDGELIHLDPQTGWPKCGCNADLMHMQYWTHTDTCHELMTKGPCILGHVFNYNSETRSTECGCDASMTTNYHEDTEQCYSLDTQGPCPLGHVFSLTAGAAEAKCRCLEGHLLHLASGTCQRAYSRAICEPKHFFKPDVTSGPGLGTCTPIPCSSSGQLYHFETDRCYPVGSVGPCQEGKLWVYERATSLKGKCHCDSRLMGYWPPHDACYPLGQQGPCPDKHVVTFSTKRGLACTCDRRRGYSRWRGRCLRVTTEDLIRDIMMGEGAKVPRQRVGRGRFRTRPSDQTKIETLEGEKTNPDDRTRYETHNSNTENPEIETNQKREGETINDDEKSLQELSFRRIEKKQPVEPSSDSGVGKVLEPSDKRLDDISRRIARLTHRGLITRRTRRRDLLPT